MACSNATSTPTSKESLSPGDGDSKTDSSSLPSDVSVEETIVPEVDGVKANSVSNEVIIPAFTFVLDSLYDSMQINLPLEEIDCAHFSMGISEVLMYCDTPDERMKSLSFCIKDVNEDGVDELLILDATYPSPGNISILDMYTTVEGTPVKVLEGWARNSYYLLNDGMFYCSGSGGAAFSNLELLSYESNSYQLTSKELYFTYPKDDDMSDCAYYYSSEGIYDVAVATEISSDQFVTFWNECEGKIVSFDAKTFDLYK